RQKFRRFLAAFLLLLIVITAIYFIPHIQAAQPTLYWGNRGSAVRTLQWKLQQWGYFSGRVDGVYGSQTYRAVIDFQRKNRLRVDGIVGQQTWRALGYEWSGAGSQQVSARTTGVSRNNDLELIARLIHAEARAEPYEGKVAVAAVLLNRVASPSFPNTISGVIYQPLAFESVANGQFNYPPTNEEVRAARSALNGWDPTHGALFFWNPSKPVNQWIWSRNIVRRIGEHVFAL
ncbi:MAG TPA: spore cortex-lytic enzyme, partial [Halanaerobiales bacterium]|nr:spore cortex-lytic enzyme [Halanaerobiales bacterium]